LDVIGEAFKADPFVAGAKPLDEKQFSAEIVS